MVRQVAIVLSGTASMSALGVLTTFILVRHLAPADYGIISIVDMVVGVSAGLLATGINWSLIRTVAANRDDAGMVAFVARRVLEVEVVYGLAVAALLFLGSRFIAERLLRHPELVFYVRLCSVGVLGSILFEYRRAMLQALKQFRWDATFGILQSGTYLGLVLLLLVTGALRIRPLAVAYVTIPLSISLLVIGLFLGRRLMVAPARSRTAFFREMAPSYGRLLCYTICLWVMNQVHMMTLTRYFPLEVIGVYAFSAKIYMMALLVMNAVKVVTLPSFAEVTDRQALRRAYHQAMRGTAVASLAWWASIPLVGAFVHFVAGGRYAGATHILQVFMTGAAVSTMLAPSSQVVIAMERFGTLAAAGALCMVLNVAGHLIITTRFGGLGAASVQVATHIVLNAIFAVVAFRGLREPVSPIRS